MSVLTIEEILAGESKNVEFKVQRPKDSIKYMKTVIAFSNGEGGRIVFGVDDDTREVVGIPKENVFSEMMRLLQQYRTAVNRSLFQMFTYRRLRIRRSLLLRSARENRDRIISSPWELRMALISGFRGHPVLLDVT